LILKQASHGAPGVEAPHSEPNPGVLWEMNGGEMEIKVWHPGMSDKETADLAYWERNALALRYADGWYNDDANAYPGWRRVLSLDGGRITFHIPDNFPVGNLPEIAPAWDGHTTEEKWRRVFEATEEKWRRVFEERGVS
jgi:hypothetical protein